ncbi:glucose 1-dehydrogenase [Paenibacillus aceris]|uniref:Threonine dehydrogenase-like Zn-dependent dehydrogenase n=1 Tax=Paenibacillus aceris TaxID=869555 RepID=A0ABS4HXZ3_9BACL|nr:glucose 1-dehydrogenase [Paenibacillus aceris]MBP1963532.1 threonine dehydrogenase-like Zn-dependent dehydrogenase [Paenibacillus aceris]NHW36796.1 glucose 1-dehydrogenase [Paenibacillus aceris]
MKAIRVKQLRQGTPSIALETVDDPVISHPQEVIVKVLAVGLDGTDKEILQEKYGIPPQGEDDLTTGHESLGVVAEAGRESGFQPGDLVTAIVRRPCRNQSCVNCRNGHSDYCQTGEFVERGIKGAHGFLSEFYKEDGRYLVQVPSELLEHGVLVEPQSIVEKVWDQVLRVQQRLIWEPKAALILGSGPLGLLAAITCRVLGLDVYVWSRSPQDSLQAQLVKDCGGVYQPAEDGGISLTAYAEGLGKPLDLILECTGFSPLAFEAMSVLAPNGVLALLGVTPADRKLEISSDMLNQSMVLENKCVIGSVNAARKDFETAIYRLQQMEKMYPGWLYRLVTNRMKLDAVPQLDFASIPIKAVVDIVPVEQWRELVKQTNEVEYSFSV